MTSRKTSQKPETSSPDLRAGAEALSRISHELKTPLVTVKGYAELLLDQTQEPLSPRLRDWVRRIAAAANRLDAMFRKVLGETRADEGWTYHPTAVDPAHWLARCIDETRALASARDLDWQWERREETPAVALDPEAGQDLLLELLQNAARATPDGGRVTATAEPDVRGGVAGARITVADTGVGVPSGAEGDALFERFVVGGALDAHHSGEFDYGAEGLGVGLAMVRGVARAHGGDAWAEGRGKDENSLPGARFCVWLPAAGRTGGSAAETPAVEARARLLVADADPEVCRILQEALAGRYDVEPAATTASALEKWGASGGRWQACLFDPLFCADGAVSFVRALRCVPGSDRWGILAYTQGAAACGAEALRAAGADACLSKPVRTRVIAQRLEALRNRKPAG